MYLFFPFYLSGCKDTTYNATYDGHFLVPYNLFDFTLLSSYLVLWEGHDISTEGGNPHSQQLYLCAGLCSWDSDFPHPSFWDELGTLKIDVESSAPAMLWSCPVVFISENRVILDFFFLLSQG